MRSAQIIEIVLNLDLIIGVFFLHYLLEDLEEHNDCGFAILVIGCELNKLDQLFEQVLRVWLVLNVLSVLVVEQFMELHDALG